MQACMGFCKQHNGVAELLHSTCDAVRHASNPDGLGSHSKIKQVSCAFRHKVDILKNYYTNHTTFFSLSPPPKGTLTTCLLKLFWISNTTSTVAVKNWTTIMWHFWLGMASSMPSGSSDINSLDTLHINRTEITDLWPIHTDFQENYSFCHYNTSSYPLIVWTYTNMVLQLECDVFDWKQIFSPSHH